MFLVADAVIYWQYLSLSLGERKKRCQENWLRVLPNVNRYGHQSLGQFFGGDDDKCAKSFLKKVIVYRNQRRLSRLSRFYRLFCTYAQWFGCSRHFHFFDNDLNQFITLVFMCNLMIAIILSPKYDEDFCRASVRKSEFETIYDNINLKLKKMSISVRNHISHWFRNPEMERHSYFFFWNGNFIFY